MCSVAIYEKKQYLEIVTRLHEKMLSNCIQKNLHMLHTTCHVPLTNSYHNHNIILTVHTLDIHCTLSCTHCTSLPLIYLRDFKPCIPFIVLAQQASYLLDPFTSYKPCTSLTMYYAHHTSLIRIDLFVYQYI